MKRAKFFIARLCGLFLLCFGLAANAEESQTTQTNVRNIKNLLEGIEELLRDGRMDEMGDLLDQLDDELVRIRSFLDQINAALYGSVYYNDSPIIDNVAALVALNSALLKNANLNGNPWWYTNSTFTAYWEEWNSFPTPSSFPLSFPEAFSAWFNSLTSPKDPAYRDQWWHMWGIYGQNLSDGFGYTWYDQVSDLIKSNIVLVTTLSQSNFVLTTSGSESNLVEELEDWGYSATDQEDLNSITNDVLPEYALESEVPSEFESTLNHGSQSMNRFVQSIAKPGTSGDPTIVLIPAFSIGGINVQEYRASLDSTIVPVCRSVMSFLYGVGLACYVFVLAKSEFAFYASFGRFWHKP